jgi:hypothetical protein
MKYSLLFVGLLVIGVSAQNSHAQLIITKVYFNPDGNDTGTEWVEIQNTSGSAINFSPTNYRVA